MRPGDDASCLNLYEPKNPRILAPQDSFLKPAGSNSSLRWHPPRRKRKIPGACFIEPKQMEQFLSLRMPTR